MGTVGYMAPEQIRGEAADHRSDIFAFGAILYEMLSGRRAFKGDTSAETMFAILKHDPLEAPGPERALPSGVERILRHCLEKSPDERFQSARDLAFDLEAISGTSDAAAAAPPVGRRWTGRGLTQRLVAGAAAVGLVLAGLATGLLLRRRPEPPAIQQVTDRRGTTFAARFTPEGRSVVYGAAWEGRPVELFESRLGSVESRPLGFADATLLAVSPRGELAVLLKPRFPLTFSQVGTLARASLSGGAVRELAEGVYFADWHPTRDELAVVRKESEGSRLEFPIGKVVYRSPGTISRIRFSPRGDTIAFFEHSVGSVLAVVDFEGHRRELAGGWSISSGGLAWAPDGREIWFTAATGAELGNLELHAASLSGRLRTVARIPGALRLHDISADGRVLVERSLFNNVMMYRGPDDSRERDLSWFRVSLLHDMTPDGRLLLFREDTIYLRRADGSPAVRLGEGFPFSEIYSLSPDGGWVFAGPFGFRGEPPLIPTSAGEARMLGPDAPRTLGPAAWLPGGRQLVVAADPQRPKLLLFDVDRGQSRALTPEGFGARFHERLLVSPDGTRVAIPGAGGRFAIVPVGGGPIDTGPALSSAERPIAWGADGRFLYTYQQGEVPGRIYRIGIRSGERTAWRELMPADPSGVWRIHPVRMTPDGRAYAYTYSRTLGSLYVYTGLE
jgi:Tol biopolymer transport system component